MRTRVIIISIICYLLANVCNAQTCTGSLGDPVVHIDFGSGSTVQGAALANGTTTYPYVTGPPSDGQYTIASSTTGMFGTWFVTTDHTGNTGGYMMVVNASYTSDTFYTQTINGLCPGTTYEFASWILNLNKAQASTASFSLPNLTFTVVSATTGAVLKTFNTGDVAQNVDPTWIQYGLTFTTPPTENSVVIKMTNNAPGGAGNDLLLDDITFRPCGPTMVSGFGAAGAATVASCIGTPKQDTLSAQISTGYTNPQYQWQVNTGSGWTDILGAITSQYIFTQPTVTGTYQYRLASADGLNIASTGCRIVSNTATLTLVNMPVATATSNGPMICEGSTLTLTGGGGTSYTWTDPNGTQFSTSQNPSISNIALTQGGTYTVTAYEGTCSAQASVTVSVQPKVTAKVSADTTICAGKSAQLTASGGSTYLWTPSTGLSNDAIANPVATPLDTTKYTVTVSNGTCSNTATVTVDVIKTPVISAGGNKIIIAGQPVKLAGKAKGSNMTYFWTPATYLDNPASLTPIAKPPSTITYTLHVITACTTMTDTAQVKVYPKLVVPTMFSPNGDGINDTWNIIGLDAYTESILSVYNRTGQLVYSVIADSKPWDGTYNGKAIPEGVYYYVIDLKNATPVLSGYVTVIR